MNNQLVGAIAKPGNPMISTDWCGTGLPGFGLQSGYDYDIIYLDDTFVTIKIPGHGVYKFKKELFDLINIKDRCIRESGTYLLTRSAERIKELGEVFTPIELVLEILDQLPESVWEKGKTYLDPTCGNGQFLAPVLIIKTNLGHSNALSTIYGVDIMQDNIDECRQRLIDIAGDTPENWDIVKNNIRCEDGLAYDYSFEKEPTFNEILMKNSTAPKKPKKIPPPPPSEVANIFG